MSVNLTLVVVVAVLVAAGVTLLLERSLTRILVGFVLMGNGVNVMFLVASGPAGSAPIIGAGDGPMADPLPQAMVLTAIVITLGITAFGLALAYRSWQLTGTDDVQDDVEDDLIRRRAMIDATSSTFIEEDETLPDEEGSDESGPGELGGTMDPDVADRPIRGRLNPDNVSPDDPAAPDPIDPDAVDPLDPQEGEPR